MMALRASAQIDPGHQALLEGGYDQPLEGQGPMGGYGFFYYNNPDLLKTNAGIHAAISPTYLNSELDFKNVPWPTAQAGIALEGGGFADNYNEVRQGDYLKAESFNGYGGGMYASVYQLLDPGVRIPLYFIARAGFHYSTYGYQDQTSRQFVLPQDQVDPFTRIGLRLAGREPMLYPDLKLEVSVWYERQWRLDDQTYGFDNDRRINSGINIYWAYAGMNYTFHNGQKILFSVTAGGVTDADRFGAWRLGGVLPLIAEYPLPMPGYFYEELTAQRFAHFYGAYEFPLVPSQWLKFRIEAATANLDYLPGFEQTSPWQTGVGCALSIAPRHKKYKIVLRYGYGINALRHGEEGANSVGVLVQYNFEAPNDAGPAGSN